MSELTTLKKSGAEPPVATVASTKPIRAGIVGASGYTSLELARLLLGHPLAHIVAATTREASSSGDAAGPAPRFSDLHPSLFRRLDMRCEAFDADALAERIDVAFLALPHGAASTAAKPLLERNVRVIDLSADYRLRDPNIYAEWYGASHADVDNLSKAVYGLPEIFAAEIADPSTRLVANPGCYPTAAILGLAPLLAGSVIETTGIIIDSKSGVSGAGRSPKLTTHFPECNESVAAYNVGKHRHTPEIAQILSDVADGPVDVLFTPHLMPMDRGIFSTAYARPVRPVDEARLLEMYRSYYAGKPFVRVVDRLPATKDVAHTNFCDIAVRVVGKVIVVLSCIDNLIKGASGAAVQNMNLMFGLPETAGL